MKMKKKIITVAVIAAVLALVVGGTLAYFTDQETAHNVITSGTVDITLQEWADEAKTEPFSEDGVDGVMPGTEVTKIVEVKNTGDNGVYVRMKVEKAIQLADEEGDTDVSLIALDINTTDWTDGGDGFYYYNEVLGAGETTKPLFTTVTFATGMGNEYQNSTATVDVTAQAVQSANNGTSAAAASGWPS